MLTISELRESSLVVYRVANIRPRHGRDCATYVAHFFCWDDWRQTWLAQMAKGDALPLLDNVDARTPTLIEDRYQF
jgi:hypothetical protein